MYIHTYVYKYFYMNTCIHQSTNIHTYVRNHMCLYVLYSRNLRLYVKRK